MLGDDLLGVALTGSLALDAYEPGRSDLDVIAVVSRPLAREHADALVDAVSHRALPCPAKRLELVVVRRGGAAFELDLDTGAGIPDHVGLDPDAEPTFWFPIDVAIARARGRSLLGPPPRELLDEPPPETTRQAVLESLDWHAEHEPTSPNAILNACRGWRWARTGRWTSKRRAAEWAR
nr:DUF4111 domain-containing protein [Actinomycetota bacterium]